MLFTYWTGGDTNALSAPNKWKERFSEFRVFGDDDILPLLDSEEDKRIFKAITIPACKSDVARLCLLREYGGFYFDSHIAPTNGDRLCELLDLTSRFEFIIFDSIWEHKNEFDIYLLNGILGGRRKSKIIDEIFKSSMENLRTQYKAELRKRSYVPYNIYVLTGPWNISMHLVERPHGMKPHLKHHLQDVVCIKPLAKNADHGFQLYADYQYRKSGAHWSERQQHERLFQA